MRLATCCVHSPTWVSRTRFKCCEGVFLVEQHILGAFRFPATSLASPWMDVIYSNILMSYGKSRLFDDEGCLTNPRCTGELCMGTESRLMTDEMSNAICPGGNRKIHSPRKPVNRLYAGYFVAIERSCNSSEIFGLWVCTSSTTFH